MHNLAANVVEILILAIAVSLLLPQVNRLQAVRRNRLRDEELKRSEESAPKDFLL